MPDVLRLQIVYETNAAASSLARLNNAQRSTTSGLRGIERGMQTLAASAVGLPGPLGNVASGLLKFGTGGTVTLTVLAGLALIGGAYKVVTDETERLAKANDKLADSFGGQFGGERVKLIADLNKSREALEKFNNEAAAMGTGAGGLRGIGQRARALLFGPGQDVTRIRAQTAAATATNAIAQQEARIKESLDDQTAAREKALKIQKEQALEAAKLLFLLNGELSVMGQRSFVDMLGSRSRTTANMANIRFGPDATSRSLDLGFGQRPDSPLRSLDTNFQGASMGLGARPEELLTNELTTQQQRIVDSWTEGMHTMQDAMEEFLVTGKLSIEQLIDAFLRIAFRAATDQFVEQAVTGVIRTVGGSAAAQRSMGIK